MSLTATLNRPPIPRPALAPANIRYIKLGTGGCWAKRCFERAELHFGAPSDPIDQCLLSDWDGARKYMMKDLGQGPGPASDAVREFRDFFSLPPGTLWVTFADGHLWWAECESEPIDLRNTGGSGGAVMRRVGGWQNVSILGAPLKIDLLSTRLSKVAAYKKTICRIAATDYLLRKINNIEEPGLARAQEAMRNVVACAEELMSRLHERQFELMADLLLTRLGWTRTSALGGPLPDVDLVVEQLASGELAFVQVKSSATQAIVDDYIAKFRASGHDRMFFICHSPKGVLSNGGDPSVHIWTGGDLADKVVAAGLFNWLSARTG